jgi:hypothetical protein
MKSVLKFLIWLYVVVAGAYVMYGWYSYTGLYRLAAEWQLEHYGSYSVKLSAIVPLLILLIPGVVLARLFGVQDQLRSAGSGTGSSGMLALLGVMALAVAVGAGWYGYRTSTEEASFESIDLSKGDTPRSAHVALTGVARTEYVIELETKIAGTTTIDRYIPLTPAAWRRGEPLVYFLKTNATVYLPPGGGKMLQLSQTTPPFEMTTQPGVLVRDGLPGPIRDRYRKSNIAVASPPTVLDLSAGADVTPFFVTAGVSGLFGFFMLVAAGAMAMRRRRLAQTQYQSS